MSWPALVLALVALQRLGELALANRNTKRLVARGGCEIGAGHYPLFILLHASVGAWQVALIWSVLNTLLLRHRIHVEDAALSERRSMSAA